MSRASFTIRCRDGVLFLADLAILSGISLLFRHGDGQMRETLATGLTTECPHCGKEFRGIRVDMVEDTTNA